MTTERQQDQQWVEDTHAQYVASTLKDVADKARVLGECFICGGEVACPTPGLCGYEVGNGTAE